MDYPNCLINHRKNWHCCNSNPGPLRNNSEMCTATRLFGHRFLGLLGNEAPQWLGLGCVTPNEATMAPMTDQPTTTTTTMGRAMTRATTAAGGGTTTTTTITIGDNSSRGAVPALPYHNSDVVAASPLPPPLPQQEQQGVSQPTPPTPQWQRQQWGQQHQDHHHGTTPTTLPLPPTRAARAAPLCQWQRPQGLGTHVYLLIFYCFSTVNK